MTIDQAIDLIETADEEELHILSNAIKARHRPDRIMLSSIIGDDVARLADALPNTQTEYKGRRYANTCAYYVTLLTELTNLVLHNFTIRKTARGIQMWHHHESIIESRAADFKAVFHSLTDTLLDKLKEHNTTY